jgi:hypothetical protein
MAMPKQRKKRRPKTPARFKVGEHVRVRHGVLDQEHPDMPLGGWAGTIAQVDQHGMCLVQWNRATLASIHPIVKKRCAIDGSEFEEYWLGESELEADAGGPLAIEQPRQITPRPLSANDPGDRVRMVFELTSDDFLPAVDEDSLETYYDYLAERLSFPMEARKWVAADLFRSQRHNGKVIELDREIGWDETDGIFCKIRTSGTEEVVPLADLQIRRSSPNYRLIDDYAEWFAGNLSEELDDEDFDDEEVDDEEVDDDEDDSPEILAEVVKISLVGGWLQIFAFVAAVGAVLGPALATMTWARWTAGIGAAVLGLGMAIGAVKGAQELPLRLRFVDIAGGFIVGFVFGAIYGAMVVAFIGAGLGAAAWLLLGRLPLGARRPAILDWPGSGTVAAGCGVLAEAFYLNPEAATSGLRYGPLVGLVCGLLLYLAVPVTVYFVNRKLRKVGYWRVRA